MLYLLDTCSYLRLAFSVHPLLGTIYYRPPESANVTSEVNTEWEKQPRLKTKFHWAGDPQYVENRLQNLAQLSGPQIKSIWETRRFVQSHAQSSSRALREARCTIPSSTDCAVLAYTLVLNSSHIPVTTVSDDRGMLWIANDLQIPAITTLNLVHQMFQAGTQTLGNVQSLAGYLNYQKDLPPDWRIDGIKLFGVSLP